MDRDIEFITFSVFFYSKEYYNVEEFGVFSDMARLFKC